jgi:hypothetical protein
MGLGGKDFFGKKGGEVRRLMGMGSTEPEGQSPGGFDGLIEKSAGSGGESC